MKTLSKFSLVIVFISLLSAHSFASTVTETGRNKDASKAVVENTEMYDALSSIPNEKLEIVQPIVEECCGTCTMEINLFIFSFSYSWCCNKCEAPAPQKLEND